MAAMFPDRVERMILDGVVNTPNYYNRYGMWVSQNPANYQGITN